MKISKTWRGLALAACLWLQSLLPTYAQPTPVQTVTVDQFQIQGMKTLDSKLADQVLHQYLGRPLTFTELERAAQAVSELYRSHDYFTVSAYLPKQELKDGNVTIKVVESQVQDLKIQGNTRYSTDYIKWMLEPVLGQEGQLPKRSVLQRQLLLLSDNMDLETRSIVQKADSSDGVDLVIDVEDDLPTHFTIDYNNLGARSSGRNRLGATFEWGNLTNRADVLTLRYVESDLLNADTDGLDLFSINYRAPINNCGTHFNFSYANSAFQAGQELQILDIRGDADVISLMLDHPIVRGTDSNLWVEGGFVFQDIENTILGTQLSRDRLREVVLGLRGDWSWYRGRNFGGIKLTHDLGEALGGLPTNDPFSSRQAGGGFTKLNLDLGRVQRFNEELYAIFRGHHQKAFDPLPFAEQYGLGGINTVRGYVQSAYLADSGYNLNAELRWAPWKKYRDNFELGFFYDHGGAYLMRPFPGEVDNLHLNGAGLGVHLKLPHDTNIRAEVGVPLSDNEITRRDGKNAVPYLIFSKRF